MIKELFAEDRVFLNERIARQGKKINPGDRIAVRLPAPIGSIPLPDLSVAFSLIYQDQDLLVIDKPGNIPILPLRVWEKGTLANALIGTYPELRGVGGNPLEPGLVHRLDRGTSGILVVGRNEPSWTRLKRDLRYRRWIKKYLTLVEGTFERDKSVDLPLAHHPSDRRLMIPLKSPETPHRGKGYPAQTRFAIWKRFRDYTLLEADLITGVTHQIRVHLAESGHPVVGDPLYGTEKSPVLGLAPGRFFLHAAVVELLHPVTREKLLFQSGLPEDLQGVLDSLVCK
jgi:23S rRNA pseudouridine1911/1915/1917 synthase